MTLLVSLKVCKKQTNKQTKKTLYILCNYFFTCILACSSDLWFITYILQRVCAKRPMFNLNYVDSCMIHVKLILGQHTCFNIKVRHNLTVLPLKSSSMVFIHHAVFIFRKKIRNTSLRLRIITYRNIVIFV